MRHHALLFAVLFCGTSSLSALAGEGSVQGKMVVNGKTIALTHVYALAHANSFHKEKEDIRVILSDAPISDDALRHDRDQLDKLAATGKFHAIAVTIGDDMFGHGKSADGNDIYTVEINKGWMNTGGLDQFEMKSLDAKAIAGRLHMKSAHEFSDDHATFDYDATFSAPILH
ncbi:MAG: hypothetical protein ABIW82_04120 [Dokdonella sp.]